MLKVIIAGSRTYNNYSELCEVCDHMLSKHKEVEVVSGTADGADKLGEKYAQERGYAIKRFPADWDKHGKSAGAIRNKDMADYADALIAFWDGQSPGTKNMIATATIKQLKVKVHMFKP